MEFHQDLNGHNNEVKHANHHRLINHYLYKIENLFFSLIVANPSDAEHEKLSSKNDSRTHPLQHI